MRVIKYFFEEPTLLDFPESTSESPIDKGESFIELMRDKRHFRGYLAASDLENNTIGGSALDDSAAAKALAAVLEGPLWLLNKEPLETGAIQFVLLTDQEEIVHALNTMASESVLVAQLNPQGHPVEDLIQEGAQKHAFGAIVRLLELGAMVVFPESAHVGHDWSIFSAEPLSHRFGLEFQKAPQDCRCFVIPYVKARGEHKFYFEQYDMELFAEYEIR